MRLPSELAAEAIKGDARNRAARLTAWLAIAFAVLMLLSYALIASIPAAHASDQEIIDFYVAANRRLIILAGLYMAPFAAIAFLWFIVLLRMWISAASTVVEDALTSNIQLVSGIIFISLVLCAAAAIATPAAAYEFAGAPVDPEVARQLPAFGDTLLFVLSMRMAAMFIITTSTIARRAGILPRWFWILGYILGIVLLFAVSFVQLFVVVFPAWMLVLGILLLVRARSKWTAQANEATGADAPAP